MCMQCVEGIHAVIQSIPFFGPYLLVVVIAVGGFIRHLRS